MTTKNPPLVIRMSPEETYSLALLAERFGFKDAYKPGDSGSSALIRSLVNTLTEDRVFTRAFNVALKSRRKKDGLEKPYRPLG